MINQNIITSVVKTLLHSLWQAPLIAILLYISIAGLKLKSRRRYVLSFLSLFIILALSVSTFFYLSGMDPGSASITGSQTVTVVPMNKNINDLNNSLIGITFKAVEEYSEIIFILWLTGMMIFLIKFGLDLYYANSIRRKEYKEVNELLLNRFKSIADKMGVKKSIRFLESSFVKVPVVIGHLKPVIILPLGLVSKIPSDQIEAIISHELAHIIRNDFLHNLIQSVIEIIYFFNPAIYFISKQIRTERENCCDDLALKYCLNGVNLAKGLYNLQRMQIDVPKPVMAAINKGDLLSRIKRIIGKEKDMKNSYTGFIASIIVLVMAVTFITGCSLFAGTKDEVTTEEAEVVVVKKSSDGEEVKMDVLVTQEGDVDMDKEITVTTTDDGKIIKKIIKTKDAGDSKEKQIKMFVTQEGEGESTITVTTDNDDNVWVSKNGEKHIIKDNKKKMIFISGDDEDVSIDYDIDVETDFDFNIEDIEKALEKALEEIEDKELSAEQRLKVKEKMEQALQKLEVKKSELEKKVKATVKKIKLKNSVSKDGDGTKIIIDDGTEMQVDKEKMVFIKDGVKKEILIDRDNMDEFYEQIQELEKDMKLNIQVLDDEKDIMIFSDSDKMDKKIEEIIIKKDIDSDISKIKMIKEVDISNIQKELVKDGILEEETDELKIFIDDDKIKINDKDIPEDKIEKYRKLLGEE